MKSFAAITLLAALASTVSAQASSGCDENYSGTFQIAPYNITQSVPSQGQTVCDTTPIVTLKNGVLTDQQDRTGEVVANHQFQFDSPVQGPTTSGFCVYSNGSLALNGNAIFYGCLSGSFSNLYDISIGAQCHEIYIVTFPCVGGSSLASSPVVASSTSSTSSTSSSTLTTSTSSTPVAPVVTSTSISLPSPAPPVIISTSTTVAPVPFPAGNSTTTAPTASMASTTSSSSSSTTASTTAPAATFKGTASIVAVGGKVVAVVAGIAAFALI